MDYPINPALKQSAPGVYKSLFTRFGAPTMAHISMAFDETLRVEDWSEIPNLRPNQAAFNPKPARILSILLKAQLELDKGSCCVAIFASLAPAQLAALNLKPPSPLAEEFRRSVAIAEIISGGRSSHEGVEKIDISIAAALLIDEVRHLHLFDSPREKKRTRLDFCEILLNSELASAKQSLIATFADAVDKQRRLFPCGAACKNS